MKLLRNRDIHAIVNDEEYEQIQRLAGAKPMTSEWLRGYLLERVRRIDEDEAVMAEVVALKAAVLNVLATLAPESAPLLKAFVEKDKLEKAQRILEAR